MSSTNVTFCSVLVARCSSTMRRGGHALIDGQRAHHLGFAEAVDVARRQHQHRRVAGLVQIDRLLRGAPARRRRPCPTRRRRRRTRRSRRPATAAPTASAARRAHQSRLVSERRADRRRPAPSTTWATRVRVPAVDAPQRLVPSLARVAARRSMPSSISALIAAMRLCQLLACATSMRRSTLRAATEPPSAARIAAANASASAATDTMSPCSALKRRISGRSVATTGMPIDEILVQLRRVDVGGVLGQPVRHDADVERP